MTRKHTQNIQQPTNVNIQKTTILRRPSRKYYATVNPANFEKFKSQWLPNDTLHARRNGPPHMLVRRSRRVGCAAAGRVWGCERGCYKFCQLSNFNNHKFQPVHNNIHCHMVRMTCLESTHATEEKELQLTKKLHVPVSQLDRNEGLDECRIRH